MRILCSRQPFAGNVDRHQAEGAHAGSHQTHLSISDAELPDLLFWMMAAYPALTQFVRGMSVHCSSPWYLLGICQYVV